MRLSLSWGKSKGFVSDGVVCNKAGVKLVKGLVKENKRLCKLLVCNASGGLPVFSKLSACGCLEAELAYRDVLISKLKEDVEILRKKNLLSGV